MKITTIASLLLILAVSIVTAQSEDPSGKSVLLAFEKTRFKTQLIDTMQTKLKEAGFKVKTVEHSKKSFPAKASEYDAIFISGNGNNSQVRPWILKWIDENKADKAKILLHTTQTRDWKVDVDVDAVTSASSQDDVDKLATDYAARLAKIAGKK